MGFLKFLLDLFSDDDSDESQTSTNDCKNEVIFAKSFGYKSPSGGYMNYAIFSVRGTNSTTNRKNTRKYECKTEDEAKRLALSDGLIDIESVEVIPFDPPTDAQIEACQKYDRVIPPNSCKIDVSFYMTRDIEGEDRAPSELIQKADSLGVKFSYLTGKQTLEGLIKNFNK